MAFIRVYVKRKIELGRLSVPQQTMFKLGTIALGRKKESLRLGLNSQGAKAKKLSKGHAIRKAKRRLPQIRNLSFTGNMLRNLSVRTVSENKARIGFTTMAERAKAIANYRIDPQIPFSDTEVRQIVDSSRRLLNTELRGGLAIAKR